LAQRKQKYQINPNAPKEVTDAASEFVALLNFEEWAAPSPGQMEAFINARDMMTCARIAHIGCSTIAPTTRRASRTPA
jgi:hypothetical protein